MLRVGLTGGVAVGKSTIAKMLVKRGAHALEADVLAHQLYAPGAVAYNAVIAAFGRDIVNPDGTISRPKLAALVFPDRIDELNAIVHPAVLEAQNRWMSEIERDDPKGIAVVEAALLIEAGAGRDFDKMIVVICDFEQKVARYAARTGLSKDAACKEVERRSAAQLSDGEKARHADYVVQNSGTLEYAESQVEKIWKEMTSLPEARAGA